MLLSNIGFSPILPISYICGFAILAFALLSFKYWRTRKLNIFYSLSIILVLLIGLNPQIITKTTAPLAQNIIIVRDNSKSMAAANRINGAILIYKNLKSALENNANYKLIEAQIDENQPSTNYTNAIENALKSYNPNEIAGAIIIGDGLSTDNNELRYPFPIHQLIAGVSNEKDQSIKLINAPLAVKIGEQSEVSFIIYGNNIEAQSAKVQIKIQNQPIIETTAKYNQETKIKLNVTKAEKTPFSIEVLPIENEISRANNAIISNLIGIQDRLRVLLVTGEPYEGARAWRNLLKSDPSLDLVHFTILRTPEKDAMASEDELSLIPFPTEELFIDKLYDFDLLVFDRFENLVGLRAQYFENVANYVKKGGALMVALGPMDIENKGVLSTQIGEVLPISKDIKLIDGEFVPQLSEIGKIHPITKNFSQNWGKWDRLFQAQTKGKTLLQNNNNPLLVVDEVQNGRVALLLSDRSWYWARNVDNGGPFRDLIGRTAHWLMKDNKLLDNRLEFKSINQNLEINYEGVDLIDKIALETPNGIKNISLNPANNNYKGIINNSEYGLYHGFAATAEGFVIHGQDGETYSTQLNNNPERIAQITKPFGAGNYFHLGIDGAKKLPQFVKITNLFAAPNDKIYLRDTKAKQIIASTKINLIPRPLAAIILCLLLALAYYFEGRGAKTSPQ
jgi:hypothetical protein